jgi:multiple sugar transport system substrate-binding protein
MAIYKLSGRSPKRPARAQSRASRRRTASKAGAAVIGATLLLAACGSSTSSTPSASKSSTSKVSSSSTSSGKVTDIVWWNMWSGATVKLTDKMVSQFNASHPTIHVTQLNVPSADGDAKLLSAIAGGDAPDLFTEWNPTIGEYAASGAIQPMNKFLTGAYAGVEKSMYPVVLDGGLYNNKLYAIPMSMNTQLLYYNKSMLKAAGIMSPPKTLAQLDADSAKEWKFSGGRLEQIGFYPANTGLQEWAAVFGVQGEGFVNGKYDLTGEPQAVKMADYIASFDKYPYSSVSAMDTAYGAVAGGQEDPFTMEKEGFEINGVWEAALDMPAVDPAMESNFGVEDFPAVPGGPTTPTSYINGNYNIIPKNAQHPHAAFEFATWLAGYNNSAITKYYPRGGWMPTGPALAKTAAFTSWIKKDPYVAKFVTPLLSKSSQYVPLTTGENEFYTAETSAIEDIATKKMTPMQALAYVDNQGNAGIKSSK